METSSLACALRTISGNLNPVDALTAADAMARAGLDNRPAFANGGYRTTDPADAPPLRPWSETDGGPFRLSSNDPPAPVPFSNLNFAHALAMISERRPAFASGGPVGLMPPHLGQALCIVGAGRFDNSIRGNSAIAAVAPVIGADGDDVAASVAFTAVLGVLVVLGLPLLVPLLGFSVTQFGVTAGLTVTL